jgi:hypothetical protein
VRDGKQDGFAREFNLRLFEYISKNPDYTDIFNNAMNSYSSMHTGWVIEALKDYDFSKIKTLCDIGGGHGHLICSILQEHPTINGMVIELESTINNKNLLWADRMGVANRCDYIAGDMFSEVPRADAYIMKMILHDWNDEECIRILSNVEKACPKGGKVFIVEHIVPGPETPHFSKLFDIHMMCALTGKERTESEYAELLEKAGFHFVQTHYPSSKEMGVIEAVNDSHICDIESITKRK